jgi:hypothetical protein
VSGRRDRDRKGGGSLSRCVVVKIDTGPEDSADSLPPPPAVAGASTERHPKQAWLMPMSGSKPGAPLGRKGQDRGSRTNPRVLQSMKTSAGIGEWG